MKNKDLEKYITELSPELQEKARHCKNMDELNELLAENDAELSDDALAAVAGGTAGSCSNIKYTTGGATSENCPDCGHTLYYWDRTAGEGNRYYCKNSDCIGCQNHWLYFVNDGVWDYM